MRSLHSREASGAPKIHAAPASGWSSPVRTFSVVVLPEPFGPM